MKWLRWVALGFVAFLVLGSFSVSLPRTFELVDRTGAPHATAYIAYEYVGGRPNLVHPITYQDKPLAVTRADSAGRIAIPIAFHAHLPFPIATHPSIRMKMVYVPAAHNALGSISDDAPARPEVFEIESPGRALIHDLSDQPELWQGSMMYLASMIQQLVYRREGEPPLRETDPTTAARTRELIAHFRQEYESFASRHRETLRPYPATAVDNSFRTAEDKRRWKESIELSLSREPYWGQYIAGMFDDELKSLLELERRLVN